MALKLRGASASKAIEDHSERGIQWMGRVSNTKEHEGRHKLGTLFHVRHDDHRCKSKLYFVLEIYRTLSNEHVVRAHFLRLS